MSIHECNNKVKKIGKYRYRDENKKENAQIPKLNEREEHNQADGNRKGG